MSGKKAQEILTNAIDALKSGEMSPREAKEIASQFNLGNESPEAKKVTRTSKGLQDTLFDEIDSLRDGTTTPQSARTVASLASGIIQTARLEMDHARFVSEKRGDPDQTGTKAITLGSVA